MSEQAEEQPWLWIIAGPNGAGKTTFATQALRGVLELNHFVNTDEIARLLSPNDPDAVLFQSGKLMLQEFQRLRRERISFAVETTLSSTSYLRHTKAMQDEGWQVGLVYVWLDSPERSLERVKARVAKGGHDVPKDVIYRRYTRSQENLIKYMSVCDTVFVYDNSGIDPVFVAHKNNDTMSTIDHTLGNYIFDTWSDDGT